MRERERTRAHARVWKPYAALNVGTNSYVHSIDPPAHRRRPSCTAERWSWADLAEQLVGWVPTSIYWFGIVASAKIRQKCVKWLLISAEMDMWYSRTYLIDTSYKHVGTSAVQYILFTKLQSEDEEAWKSVTASQDVCLSACAAYSSSSRMHNIFWQRLIFLFLPSRPIFSDFAIV